MTVSSGEPTEKTLTINVDLPSSVTREVTMKVYINGINDSSNSKTLIPAYNSSYSFSITGSGGTKNVVVNLDGQKYRVYEVNFESGTVRTMEKYSYTNATMSSSSSNNANNSTKRANIADDKEFRITQTRTW